MKTIIFTSFGLGAFISNFATTHPNLFYLALSILAGFLLALLVALLTVGPSPRKQAPPVQTPAKRQANVTQAARKTAKRQAKKTNFQNQHGIDIYNYPQGAYA
jgi:ABC-type anion transport system duplicated permease subunit